MNVKNFCEAYLNKALNGDEEDIYRNLGDPLWRLDNLYTIVDKRRHGIPFKLNQVQRKLIANWHPSNVVLKARKTGVCTVTSLLMLDTCLFSPNEYGEIIAPRRDKADALYRELIQFAYDRLHENFKIAWPVKRRRNALMFANGSVLEVVTKLGPRTPTMLYATGMDEIADTQSDKADEILALAWDVVSEGGWELMDGLASSTGNLFTQRVLQANARGEGKNPRKTDPYLHFFPWYEEPAYAVPTGTEVDITQEDKSYFAKIERESKVALSLEQRIWYVWTRSNTYPVEASMMKREFPSTVAEAIKAARQSS